MRLLLDTHILIWQQEGRLKRLGAATEVIRDASELLFSVVSFAEIGIKMAVGKLHPVEGIREHAIGSGVRILGLAPDHGLGVRELPLHHRDPFDRLLISQARSERLTILTADSHFTRYDVPVVLAGA